MRRRAAVAVLALVAASSAVAAPVADVTLRVEPFYDHGAKFHRIRFSGTIASNAANQYVAVLAKICGESYEVNAAGASTVTGGAWQVQPPFGRFDGQLPATYRARWEDKYSEPVTIKPRIPIELRKLKGGRYNVEVEADVRGPKLRGRAVHMQRLQSGRWTTVRTARLGPGTSVYDTFSYSATLTYSARRATLRVAVPTKTAAPCYAANATRPWTTKS